MIRNDMEIGGDGGDGDRQAFYVWGMGYWFVQHTAAACKVHQVVCYHKFVVTEETILKDTVALADGGLFSRKVRLTEPDSGRGWDVQKEERNLRIDDGDNLDAS